MNEFVNTDAEDDIDIVATISEHYAFLCDEVEQTGGARKERLTATLEDTISPIAEEANAAQSDADLSNAAIAYYVAVSKLYMPQLTPKRAADMRVPLEELADSVHAHQQRVHRYAHEHVRRDDGTEHITKHLGRMAAALESIRKSMTLLVGGTAS
jgi:hypothetical protein